MNKRWKPKFDCAYWYVKNISQPDTALWYNDDFDRQAYAFGNVFKTKRQAQQAAKAVKKILLALHRGNND